MKKALGVGFVLVVLVAVYILTQAGDLEPPGAPAPTMVDLDTINEKVDALMNASSVTSTHQFIGVTTSTTNGGNGWKHMNDLCQSAFGGTYPSIRMCRSIEIMNTPSSLWPSLSAGAWSHPTYSGFTTFGVYDVSGMASKVSTSGFPGETNMTCASWTWNDSSHSGLALNNDGIRTTFNLMNCNSENFITCCAPYDEIP